jgi:hypothetical protein
LGTLGAPSNRTEFNMLYTILVIVVVVVVVLFVLGRIRGGR